MDLTTIKDELEGKEYLTELVWTVTTRQMADCLTKWMAQSALDSALASGKIPLIDKENKKQYPEREKVLTKSQQELEEKISMMAQLIGEEAVETFFSDLAAYSNEAMIATH